MLRVVVHSLKQSAENASAETNVGAPTTRIDVGPRLAGSHADFEPAATSQPPVVKAAERPAKAAAKVAASHKPAPAKAAKPAAKAAVNGKSSAAAKTNRKAKAAKPVAKAAANHKSAAKSAPAKKSAKAAPAKAKRK